MLPSDETIVVNKPKIEINNLIIDDPDISSYFENIDSDKREQKLKDVLRIGIVATKSIDTAGNVNYVEKAFENLNNQMNVRLDDIFAEHGEFARLLQEHFGEDGTIITELFDPNRDGTPLHLLNAEIKKELEKFQKPLEEIRNQIIKNKGAEEEAEKGTRKGIEFEDLCEESLNNIASIPPDKIERTGAVSGILNKKGDFVITPNGLDKKVVFEMKDDQQNWTRNAIQKELDATMRNRDADYGIFVIKNKNNLSGDIGWFNEYDGRHLVCAIEDNEGNTLPDVGILHIAYRWARARLQIESVQRTSIDQSFIIEKARAVKTQIDKLKIMKANCTTIEAQVQKIRDTTNSIESNAKKELDAIFDSLEPQK